MTKEDIEEIKKSLSIEVETNYGYAGEDNVHTIKLKWEDEIISETTIYAS